MDHETTMPGLLTRPAALQPQAQQPRRRSGFYKLVWMLLAALLVLGLGWLFS